MQNPIQPGTTPETFDLVAADTVEAKEINWTWRDRIPAGMLTLVAGHPGTGKSMFTSFLAAEVSQTAGVLFSNAEDPVSRMTRPRLEAAGANLSNIHIVPENQILSFPRDGEKLRATIYKLGIKLVILDPIASHMGVSLFNDQEARKAIKPLAEIADETGCAIIMVAHLNKGASKKQHPLAAIGGSSGGVVGASRAVYIFGADPDDNNMRVMAPAKVNFGPASTSVAFDMEETEWALGEGRNATIIRTGKLAFLSDTHKATARDILDHASGNKTEVKAEAKALAAEWLTGLLALGAQSVKQIRDEAGQNGISWATLRRAADEIGVVKARTGFGPGSFISWELPAGHPAIAAAASAPAPQAHGPAVVPPIPGGQQMDVNEVLDLILAETVKAEGETATDETETSTDADGEES